VCEPQHRPLTQLAVIKGEGGGIKKIIVVLTFVVLLVPIAVWALYKPVRVLAPAWVDGVSCVAPNICIEDKSRYTEAQQLYDNALQSVSETVGPFHNKPALIFCTSPDCYNAFGFNKSAAKNVGRSGIVVSPRGWKPWYIRHEMIHYRQSEELGLLSAFTKPEWFTEGMAYSLSHDPRKTLSDRWQQDRSKFDIWFKGVGADNLWKEAEKL